MAGSHQIVGELLAVGILGAIVLLWKPKICGPLTSMLGNTFDFCTFQQELQQESPQTTPSLRPKKETKKHRPINTTKDTGHPKPPNLHGARNTLIHATRAANKAKHLATGHALPPATQAQKCAGTCQTIQCTGCPAPDHPGKTFNPATNTFTGFAEIADFRMSI